MNRSDVNVELDIMLVLDRGNAAGVTNSAYLSCLMEVNFKQLQN